MTGDTPLIPGNGYPHIVRDLAAKTGTTPDKLGFILAELCAIGLALVYSILLCSQAVPPAVRKFFLIILGVLILCVCFGSDVIFFFVGAMISYLLIKALPSEILPPTTLVFMLGYQSILHVIRQYTYPGGYTVDITGPLMILTQRASALAFSIRDGEYTRGLSGQQVQDAVAEAPDALSYFAYTFDFHVILAGPFLPYNAFLSVVKGRRRGIREWQFQLLQAILKLVTAAGIALVILKTQPLVAERNLLSDRFASLPYHTKLLYLILFTGHTRLQYYVAWKLAEAACVISGYGHYVTPSGEERWDGADNIDIAEVETAPSIKVLLDNWNTSTQRWLKHVCHDREGPNNTLRTFLLSAVWHGLYPGYFLSFLTIMLFVLASRHVRRHVKPRLLSSNLVTPRTYDLITFAFTVVFTAYASVPFILLQFDKSHHVWRHMFYCGHLVAVLPFALPHIFS